MKRCNVARASKAGSLKYFSALVIAIVASTAQADTLLDVVEKALDRSPDLAQSRADAKIAHLGIAEARAALLPRVGGGWGRAYNQIAVSGYPSSNYWQSGWTVQLSQPIFDWSKWVDYRSANAVNVQGELELKQREQDMVLQAARAYFDEIAAENEVARADAYVEAVLSHQKMMGILSGSGEATVIDLQEAQSSVESAQLTFEDARVQMQVKRQALERLTGTPFDASMSPRSHVLPVLPSLVPDDQQQWVEQAETKSYPVQVAQMNLQVSDLGVDKARSQRYPVVSIDGSYTPASAASGYSRPSTTAVAMLSVSIPIFQGGAINAGIDKAIAARGKADDALRAAIRDAGADAQDSYTRFRWSAERARRLGTLSATNDDKLKATETGFRVGSRSNADVLRALDALYTSRRDLLKANYDAIVAYLGLKASTATLSMEDIADLTQRMASPDATGPEARQNASAPVATTYRPESEHDHALK
ncbi:TolC family outer membrane protein [Paraburkholderia dinghuensis]|uniref:TolC family outer membrane protein n=1 Tax=Paraburkholderia dinghuensis TaxID=2305225 RepID=UPI001629D220|nr:TolC family outer membrane protein [Paraburkholderia dinghuensis]